VSVILIYLVVQVLEVHVVVLVTVHESVISIVGEVSKEELVIRIEVESDLTFVGNVHVNLSTVHTE